jgi:hypothetical protein
MHSLKGEYASMQSFKSAGWIQFVLHCFQIIAHFKANTAPTSECNDSSVQTFVSSVQRRFGLLIGKVISIGNDVLIWK